MISEETPMYLEARKRLLEKNKEELVDIILVDMFLYAERSEKIFSYVFNEKKNPLEAISDIFKKYFIKNSQDGTI